MTSAPQLRRPEPPSSEPPSECGTEPLTDVEVVLCGSIAVVTGIVEQAGDRRRIVDAIASLESISEVEDNLRPPAA